nr:uncharacterized protein LOC109150823 [Ipomoea batatas]
MGEPKFIYFTTNPIMQIDDPDGKKKEISPSSKQTQFNQCLDYELQLNSNIDISDAELIFFAVLRHDHYFIICLNFKKRVVQVIDNKTLGKGFNFVSRYENCDQILHELVKMYWKNPSNVTDCGIYCMRHMETFKGIGPNWDSGFNRTAADDLFLTSLRAKYAVDIIFSEMNQYSESVLNAARNIYNL